MGTYTKGMSGYSVYNFGCRASTADGDAIAAQLAADYGMAGGSLAAADVVVVNTCAVTEEAERSARALIRRVRRENPGARVVVTGCYAQRAPEELRALPGVDAVVGNSHKDAVPRMAHELSGRPKFSGPLSAATRPAASGFVPLHKLAQDLAQDLAPELAPVLHAPFGHTAPPWTPPLLHSGGRTRPILKVQDGCGNRCSFCVIPQTRGRSRSLPLAAAVEAARSFAGGGGQELVLSGINLGRWGRDLQPAHSFADLVRALLEETALPRLRLSSVEPMDWGPELFALFARYGAGAEPRLAPHAHLPLQSGADAVLRAMHRRYRPWHYADKVRALRALLPEAAIGADVMVGFPGETEALFAESLRFIEAQPFTYLHLFPFSPRSGTAAERFHRERPVDAGTVRRRMEALLALSAERTRAFTRRFLGRRVSAVTLSNGTALTANYLSVKLHQPLGPNQLLTLLLASMEGKVLVGHTEVPSPPEGAEHGLFLQC